MNRGPFNRSAEVFSVNGLAGAVILDSPDSSVSITTSGGKIHIQTSGGSGTITAVTNSDGSLTFVTTSGSVVGSLNVGHANSWSALQTFGNINFATLAAPATPTLTLIATGTGNCTNGGHTISITYVNAFGETQASASSNSVTVDSSHKQMSVNIPVGPAGTTGVNIYMQKNGVDTNKYRLGTGTTIAGNAGGAFIINIADGSISSIVAPTVNTTGGALQLNGTTKIQMDAVTGYVSIPNLTSSATFNSLGNEKFGLNTTNTATGGGSTIFGYHIGNSADNATIFGTIGTTTNTYAQVTGIGGALHIQADNATLCGFNTQVTGNSGFAGGNQAYANGDYSISILGGVSSGCTSSISIGLSSGSSDYNQVNIGYASTGASGAHDSVALGPQSRTFAPYQVVTAASDMYLSGGQSGGPAGGTYHGANAQAGGSNVAGGYVALAGGLSTGTGNGGDIRLQLSLPGASGTTQNALYDLFRGYGDNGRGKFQGGVDLPITPTSFANVIDYPDGTFYTGYPTDTNTQGYRLYAEKFNPATAANYYTLTPATLTVTNNNSVVSAPNATSGAANINYGIASGGTYLTSGRNIAYQMIAKATVNGVSVFSSSPATASVSDDNHQIFPGDATSASASQQSGGGYTPASTDFWEYLIYAHATYNGVDIYSATPAYCSVSLDGVTDPFLVVISYTDATFPVGATFTGYTITKQINGGGYNAYTTSAMVGGSFVDHDPTTFTAGGTTLTPNSTPDPYSVTVTWIDPPTWDVAIDPSSEVIEITRTVNGTPSGSVNVAVGVHTLNDTGDAIWTGAIVTNPTTVQSYFRNDLSWGAVAGAINYKLFYSPNNFVPITTPTPSFPTQPSQVDFSGTYSVATGTADGSNINYAVYAYQVLSGVRVYSGFITNGNTDNSDGNPYAWQVDFTGVSFDPAATSMGYMLVRNVQFAGYNEHLDIGNVTSYLDTNSGWTTGAVPGIGNTSGIVSKTIETGNVTTFTDTGSLTWTNNYTVTPTGNSATYVTVNPPNYAFDINGNYFIPAVPPQGSNQVLASTGGVGTPLIWQTNSFPNISGTVSNGQLPFGSGSNGNMLFGNSALLSTFGSPIFDFGSLYRTMRVPTVLAYGSGLQVSGTSGVVQYQMYAVNQFSSTNTCFEFYNLQSGQYGLKMMHDGDRGNWAFATGNMSARPDASALIEMQSTTQGLRFPNMTTTQKNAISSPAKGVQVFDTTLNKMSYYNGTTWINF